MVAAVAGAEVGTGATMLMHCDLVYAADNAKFSMPFTQLGLYPEFASSLLVAQSAGYTCAAEKLMLGEAFGPGRIRDGLRRPRTAGCRIAGVRSGTRPPSWSHGRPNAALVAETMGVENKQFGTMLVSAEAREAFTAFFQKRKADFSKYD